MLSHVVLPAKPSYLQWFLIILMVSINKVRAAYFTRLANETLVSYCVVYCNSRLVSLWVPLLRPFGDSPPLRAMSRLVVRAVMVAIIGVVGLYIPACTALAFVQMTICHLWVPVELTQRQCFVALETLFHGC